MAKLPELTIGNIKLKNSLMLAPMAGITDMPVRVLATQNGAGLVYTEMVSARALVYDSEKTKLLMRMCETERPTSIQIFGSEPAHMAQAAKMAEAFGADIVDINLGCPAKKITKTGAGSKLLADIKTLSAILQATRKSIKIPLTIKIRIGLVPGQNIAPEVIKLAYETGINMVAVHARPASLGHTGLPDIEAFRVAAADAKLPVIANGGIEDEKTAQKFLDIPNCGGLMIGRGAIGNYSLFSRLENYFNNGQPSIEPSWEQRINWLRLHAEASVKHYGEEKGIVILRKLTPYYIKDIPNASKIRDNINKISTLKEFENAVKQNWDTLSYD
ncbi:MAG: tRNA dihydrouridine synthase DusB [Elusimicrobia bacterium]|nr:tRNA dihydrouridine synthase DusB [Elusimicrobiota bacterium]